MRSWLVLPFQMALVAFASLLLAFLFNVGASPRRHLPWTGLLPGLKESLDQGSPEKPLSPAVVGDTQPLPPVPQPGAEKRVKAPVKAPIGAPVKAQKPEEPKPTLEWGDFGIRDIPSDQAFAAFNAGLPFLDARRSADFEAEHIQGAYTLPVWETNLDEHLIQFEAVASVAPESPVVIYCGGGGCDDSHLLANRLRRMGYRRLWIYTDGFPDWKAHNRPLAKGAFQGRKR